MFLLCCSLQVLPLQYTYSLHHGQKAHFCSHSTPADRCVCCNISVQSECSTQAHTYTHRDQPLPVPALLCAEGSGCWRVTTTLLFSALVYSLVGNSGSPWQAAVVVDKKKRCQKATFLLFSLLLRRSECIETIIQKYWKLWWAPPAATTALTPTTSSTRKWMGQPDNTFEVRRRKVYFVCQSCALKKKKLKKSFHPSCKCAVLMIPTHQR